MKKSAQRPNQIPTKSFTGERESKARRIYEELKNYITSPEREIGDRLLSNRKLAAMLNVSTFPISQALQRLENEGYVELRNGSGTYIASRHRSLTMADVVSLCMHSKDHLWSNLLTMFMEALAEHGKIGSLVGIDPKKGSGQGEVIRRIGYSESKIMVVQGSGHFPYSVFDLPGMKQKTTIAVFSWVSESTWPGLYRVLHDVEAGGDMVAKHLWAQGHRKVMLVGTDTQIAQIESDRPDQGYPACHFRHKWESMGGEWTKLASHSTNILHHHELDEKAFLKQLKAKAGPTAIFGLRDYEAWLAQNILLHRKPAQAANLEVVGYGNTEWSKAGNASFSSIDFNFETIVNKAISIIDQVSEGRTPANDPILIKPKLVIRNHSKK
ncbi:GntR family transcriptional regulator [Puniceicoccus vermicola]|uniref:GntR family transcriptional regulator n=1 Tax=Puniceicoccus vermicola TaxID=388746 RepID=A0A7X1B059_9BACT|nr:GntR family transcriptional regulator [Puniceicoccus vermicola]MBC2603191.1 GntR family transcriptional regulator [Puniceicoccus vermicola]